MMAEAGGPCHLRANRTVVRAGGSRGPAAARAAPGGGVRPPSPGADVNVLSQWVQRWSTRADAAIIHSEPPWDSLIAGVPPETLIVRERVGLVDFFRALGLRVVITVDATNGINRAGEQQPPREVA